jgi:hypothetical protein
MADEIRLDASALEDRLLTLRAGIRRLTEQANSLSWAIRMLPSESRYLRMVKAELRVRLRELEQETEALKQLYSRTLYCISYFQDLETDLSRMFQGTGESRRFFPGQARPGSLPGIGAIVGWRPVISSLYRHRRFRYSWFRRNNNRLFLLRRGLILRPTRIYHYRYGFVSSRARRRTIQSYLRARNRIVYRRTRSFVPGWLRRLY